MKQRKVNLDGHDKAIFEWQLDVPGFGEAGQEKLKGASVLVSRAGGLARVPANERPPPGDGHIILAHAGNIKPSDLNRQLLMTYAGLGSSRAESAAQRIRDLNPHIKITAIPENISPGNAAGIVGQADIVVDCAPLFEERLAMNSEIVRQGKPLIECAMYELQGQVTTILPGQTPCLACLYPEKPAAWRRRFPVFGAVSGTAGCIGAMEAIKVISGLGNPLAGRMLTFDLREMDFRLMRIHRRMDCPVCGNVHAGE